MRSALTTMMAAAVFMVPQGAGAVTLNLDSDDVPDFADGFVDDGDQASAGPFVVTFDNVVAADGLPGSIVDGDGPAFGIDPVTGFAVSMDLVFNVQTVITEYDIDFVAFPGGSPSGAFQLSGPNGTTALNDFSSEGRFSFDMGTIPFFIPGVAYTLTHTLPNPGLAQIDEFELQAVPLPASLLLLLTGVGGVALLGRRG